MTFSFFNGTEQLGVPFTSLDQGTLPGPSVPIPRTALTSNYDDQRKLYDRLMAAVYLWRLHGSALV